MNNRAFTISFVVAFFAVFMVYSYVSSTEEQYKQKFGEEVIAVIAKTDIKELDTLDENNLEEISIPKTFSQAGKEAKISQFSGTLALGAIKKGEQITPTRVTMTGARTGLARKVTVNKRAVTIRINDEAGVSKLLKPGDRVDILGYMDIDGGNKRLVEVKTIFQDITILATGRFVTNTIPAILEKDPQRPDSKQKVNLSEYANYANVTLEVTPEQAQMLVLMEKAFNGVWLTLRNNDDTNKLEIQSSRVQNIIGERGAPNMAPQAGSGPPPPSPPRR